MSTEFPEELAGQRDEILQHATARGTKLGTRRRAPWSRSLLAVFSVLAGTVTVIAGGNHANRVVTSEPDATTLDERRHLDDGRRLHHDRFDGSAGAVGRRPTSAIDVRPRDESTADHGSRVSQQHDPPLRSDDIHVDAGEPAAGADARTVGDRRHGEDACLRLGRRRGRSVHEVAWGDGQSSYGPGPTVGCVAMGVCAIPEPRYGPWDPPQPDPRDDPRRLHARLQARTTRSPSRSTRARSHRARPTSSTRAPLEDGRGDDRTVPRLRRRRRGRRPPRPRP